MNFIISNQYFKGFQNIGSLYITNPTVLDEKGFLVFDGWLYPEYNLDFRKLYEKVKQEGKGVRKNLNHSIRGLLVNLHS